MTNIRVLQISTNPLFDLQHIGEIVAWATFAGIQRGKADAKADVINIRLVNNLITKSGRDARRVLEQIKQVVAGEAPTFLVAVGEGFGIPEGLGVRDDAQLAVDRASELAGGGQDDSQVEGSEDVSLDGLGVPDEVVRTHLGLDATGRDEVVEAGDTLLERISWVGLQAGKDQSDDFFEPGLEDLAVSGSACVAIGRTSRCALTRRRCRRWLREHQRRSALSFCRSADAGRCQGMSQACRRP